MYSVNHKSLDKVKDGVTIGVPQDAVNQERAVRLIEELVNFKVLDSAQILVSLKDLGFGIVNGNFITDAGKITLEAAEFHVEHPEETAAPWQELFSLIHIV